MLVFIENLNFIIFGILSEYIMKTAMTVPKTNDATSRI